MDTTIPSLYAKNKTAFKDFTANIPDALQAGLWKAADGDSYDTLLMVRCPDKKPFFLFIENKSPNIKTDPGVEAPDVVRK